MPASSTESKKSANAIILFGIKNCNTVKKAQAWLDQNFVAYEFHDYKKQGVEKEVLEKAMHKYGWEKIVNKSGLTWRKLPESEKNKVTDSASALRLMEANSSVVIITK